LTSGGLGPLTYAYGGLPFGCSSQDSATLTCTPTVAGTYSITVVVTDAASRTTSAAVSLTVGQAVASPPPMTLFGLAAWEAYVLFAVLGIAVGIGIGVAFAGRKRKRPT
jgi:ferredoxin-NADP reductase